MYMLRQYFCQARHYFIERAPSIKMAISLSFRHYWHEYFDISPEAELNDEIIIFEMK